MHNFQTVSVKIRKIQLLYNSIISLKNDKFSLKLSFTENIVIQRGFKTILLMIFKNQSTLFV
ncbi:hypothetical protein MED217_10802 [Leeuwenhoekiella blandensis MED217]|uniref:Uncharacterized protein n=1 Tax=Leeuwenhoekiella blandensis (strain CECT 7118 / CCUG 51940 / KCTC 22103 / MED217) TaxID=398720 RepID=A3XN39_LEEBM|nr:hypothetical protein MED217_10802 [Leeuwenhoekiella blandensis MED217]